jgi:dTDP-4-dehydrorhamnose 3,5-epimerase
VARVAVGKGRQLGVRRPPRKAGTRAFSRDEGFIPGTTKDKQVVRSDWLPAQTLLDGVKVMEVRNVSKRDGLLTEVFRTDWKIDDGGVDQVFQVVLGPGEVSAWHVHRATRDRLFVNHGSVRIVLYDARRASPTHGGINQFQFGSHRPALVLVPPGVWHGLQNLRDEESLVLNMVDRAYSYEDPDHWRLPPDSAVIPYEFDFAPRRRRARRG